MIVNVKMLNKNAIMPTRGSKKAAGYDLYACTDTLTEVPPHSTVKVGTGLAIQPPRNCFGAIFARSGLATKQGLRPANCVGVCDEDYTGEYIVAIHNDTDETRYVEPHERIAQLVFVPYIPVVFNQVNELQDTERGDSGFGSTGTK